MTSMGNEMRDADQPGASFADRQPLSWIAGVIDQLVAESGLTRSPDIEDLVIIAYLGLLDSPHPHDLGHSQLLARSRRAMITWAWEQGAHHQQMSTTTVAAV